MSWYSRLDIRKSELNRRSWEMVVLKNQVTELAVGVLANALSQDLQPPGSNAWLSEVELMQYE